MSQRFLVFLFSGKYRVKDYGKGKLKIKDIKLKRVLLNRTKTYI